MLWVLIYFINSVPGLLCSLELTKVLLSVTPNSWQNSLSASPAFFLNPWDIWERRTPYSQRCVRVYYLQVICILRPLYPYTSPLEASSFWITDPFYILYSTEGRRYAGTSVKSSLMCWRKLKYWFPNVHLDIEQWHPSVCRNFEMCAWLARLTSLGQCWVCPTKVSLVKIFSCLSYQF